MLEHLFGSKTRVRILRLFLNKPSEAYFVRELTRKIGAQINAVRNELGNLVKMEMLSVVQDPSSDPESSEGAGASKLSNVSGKRKYYALNTESLLYPELRALFLKSRVLLEKDLVRKITRAGSVSYLVLTGHFVGEEDGETDMFLVGRVNRTKLTSVIRDFEREIGCELNYTIMTPQEYKYRRDVTDVFLYKILESKKIVVIDTLTEKMGLATV